MRLSIYLWVSRNIYAYVHHNDQCVLQQSFLFADCTPQVAYSVWRLPSAKERFRKGFLSGSDKVQGVAPEYFDLFGAPPVQIR